METWKVAIALSMSSNHAAVLSALSSSLLGVHAQVNKLQGGFSRLKLAIGGALSVTAGMALLGVMEKIVDKTKDYSDELIKLQRLGGPMADAVQNGTISRRAFDISSRVPMTVTDLAKIPGAGYSILGQEAYDPALWEKLARFQYVMRSQNDYHGDAGKDMSAFLRAGELGGRLTDPNTHKAAIAELERFLDLSNKVMAATHGMVTPQTMLGMSQQAGFSMRGMTDEGFMNMAIAAQAMGGPRAGTAMLSLYNQVATGKMTKPAALGMQDLGLLREGEWYSDHGKVVVNNSAMARLGKILGRNPMDFVDEIYKNLEKQGITDPDEQKRRVAAAMSRQTSERFVIEQMMNREQIAAERGRMGQALGSDSSFGLIMDKSVTANMEALNNAWTNLLTAVAGPNSQNVISVLQMLTSNINAMTQAINGMNPETLKNLGMGLGILAAALVGSGVVAIAAAIGPAGWLVAGLIALGGAALAWGPQIQGATDKVRDFFLNLQSRVLNGIYSMGDAIFNALKSVWDKITALFGSLGGGGGQFKKDLDDANKLYVPGRFEPGMSHPKPQPITLALNVDGQTLARVVSDKLDALFRYDTNTPAFNGAGSFRA